MTIERSLSDFVDKEVKSFFVCKFTFSLLGYCILCGVLAELCKDAALFFIVFCHIE